MRNKRKSKYNLPDSTLGSVLYIICIIAPIVLLLFFINKSIKNHVINPVVNAKEYISPLSTKSAVLKLSVTPKPTSKLEMQYQIDSYIKIIFGSDAPVALAIQRNECNPKRADYPSDCVLHTNLEYSIGIFQINVKSAYAKVHFDRIPGKTLEEKIKWLKNPYNNTLMAHWIFSTSGFYPWTSYKNGAYLNNL